MMRGVFITGTDTGVGKTLAACALIHALAARGVRALPMKPIAAGGIERGGRLANEDSLALMAASRLPDEDLADVTPILLGEAMAPHIAAAREGRRISLDPVRAAFRRLASRTGFFVVEGIGGFLVPLADDLDATDLARELRFPVVVVVGMRLGCLNHALLTARAVAAAGLELAGWIANGIDPAMRASDENVAALQARLRAPLLGRLPYCANPDPARLALHLDVAPLLAVPS